LLKHLAFVAPLTFAFAQANAFDLNDCILNGMKGVSSDVADAANSVNACKH